MSDTTIACVDAREILDSRGNPDRRGRCRARRRLGRPGGGPVRRVDRGRTRRSSCATATRPATAARASCRRSRNVIDTHRPGAARAGRRGPGGIDRLLHRARRHAEQGRARRERHPRRLARVRPRGRRPRTTCRSTATSAASARGSCPSRCSTSSTAASTPRTPPTSRSSWSCPSGSTPSARRCGPARRSSPPCAAILHDEGHATGQGDEGGFAPSLPSNEAAVEVILRAIERAGYRPGEESRSRSTRRRAELVEEGTGGDGVADRYRLANGGPDARVGRADRPLGRLGRRATRSSRSRTASPRTTGPAGRCSTARLGDRVQLVGDDLLVTNPERSSQRGIDEDAANAVLIKLNQIGTLTETIDAIELARRAGWSAVVSPSLRRDRGHHDRRPRRRDRARARSRPAPRRARERVAKYNRLLRIAGELGDERAYLGSRGAVRRAARPLAGEHGRRDDGRAVTASSTAARSPPRGSASAWP